MSAPLHFQLLGEAVRLESPGALLLLLLVALLALVGARGVSLRRRRLRQLAGPLAPRVAPGAGAARPAARLALSALGLALLALGLSRPQCGARAERDLGRGLDLAVALDVSRSMLAGDEAPDRLGRARLEVAALLDRLEGDRVALVAFAGEAAVLCPLTADHAAARLLLRAAGPGSVARPGTDLAAGLRAAGEALAAVESAGRARAVLLVSDGEGHEPGAEEEAAALGAEGIPVLAVGVGTAAGAPLPPRPGEAGAAAVQTRLEEGRLRTLAARGRGRYFGPGGASLPELAEELSRLSRSSTSSPLLAEGRTLVVWEERYPVPVFPGFLFLLAGALLRERPRLAGAAR